MEGQNGLLKLVKVKQPGDSTWLFVSLPQRSRDFSQPEL
jgi:hypothetical protein